MTLAKQLKRFSIVTLKTEMQLFPRHQLGDLGKHILEAMPENENSSLLSEWKNDKLQKAWKTDFSLGQRLAPVHFISGITVTPMSVGKNPDGEIDDSKVIYPYSTV